MATNEGHGRQTLDNLCVCVCVIELLAVMTGMSLCVQEMVYRLDISVMRYKKKIIASEGNGHYLYLKLNVIMYSSLPINISLNST